MFAEQQQEQPEGGQQFTAEQIQSLIDERFSEQSTKAAESQYKEDYQRMESLVGEYAKQLIPNGVGDQTKAFIKAAFEQMVIQANRSDQWLYPEDHPLHSKAFKPLSRDAMEKVLESARPIVTELIGAQGMSVAKSKPVSTPAGKRGTEGNAEDEGMTTQERTRARAREAMSQVLKKHASSGEPTSAASRG
jgi:hypothetical protein